MTGNAPGLREYFRYKWDSGFWSFLLHRVTGLGLVVYLGLHIYSISNLRNPAAFDAEMELFARPIFKFGEMALFFAILFHSLNGIRLVLVDLTDAARYHKLLLRGVIVIGLVFFVYGVYKLFPTAVLS